MASKFYYLIRRFLIILGLKDLFYTLLLFYFRFFPFVTINRNSVNFYLDRRELIDRSLYFNVWEKNTIKFINKYIKSGDVVFEVGSNIGAHTLFISQKVGINGCVYAFEPTNYARKKLEYNLSLNQDLKARVKIYENILSNNDLLEPNRLIRSSWSIVNRSGQITEELVKSTVTSIDKFIIENKISKLNILKVDVDGYDYKVLSGARETILKFKPIIYVELFEILLNRHGDSLKDIFNLLIDLGYTKIFNENGTRILTYTEVIDSPINAIFINHN